MQRATDVRESCLTKRRAVTQVNFLHKVSLNLNPRDQHVSMCEVNTSWPIRFGLRGRMRRRAKPGGEVAGGDISPAAGAAKRLTTRGAKPTARARAGQRPWVSPERQRVAKRCPSRGAKGLCVKKEGKGHEDKKYIARKGCQRGQSSDDAASRKPLVQDERCRRDQSETILKRFGERER